MHLTYDGVNTAFREIVTGIFTSRIPTTERPSRNGPVLQVDGPVIVTYTEPQRRILFNQARDANPFFHLYESLWMLAGRNDVKPLAYYVDNVRQYSDNGKTFNGAYGRRWRYATGEYDPACGWPPLEFDQLTVIIEHLHKKPESRRAVLSMWTPLNDLLEIDRSKDVCCNTHAYFAIDKNGKLEMTVCNRSNDLIWGMLGTNVVHFSFLQEYLAGWLGVGVGCYHQMTNNLHVYTEGNSGWKPKEWLAEYTRDMHSPHQFEYGALVPSENLIRLTTNLPDRMTRPEFDEICGRFVEANRMGDEVTANTFWNVPFLDRVAQPMCHAFHMHRQRDYFAAEHWARQILAPDWGYAAITWIAKRRRLYERKLEAEHD